MCMSTSCKKNILVDKNEHVPSVNILWHDQILYTTHDYRLV